MAVRIERPAAYDGDRLVREAHTGWLSTVGRGRLLQRSWRTGAPSHGRLCHFARK
jgi:hypothetical protein